MAVDDIYQVRILTIQGPQIGLNVRHYRALADTVNNAAATAQSAATTIDLALAAAYKALMATTATYRGVGVRKIFPLPITTEFTSIANTGPGTVAGDPLPLAVSGITTIRTGIAGRANRGRVYFPFPAETQNGPDGHPSAAYVAAMAAAAALLIADELIAVAIPPGGVTLRPIIWHKAAANYTDVTGYTTRALWATQHRRGDYGKANIPPF